MYSRSINYKWQWYTFLLVPEKLFKFNITSLMLSSLSISASRCFGQRSRANIVSPRANRAERGALLPGSCTSCLRLHLRERSIWLCISASYKSRWGMREDAAHRASDGQPRTWGGHLRAGLTPDAGWSSTQKSRKNPSHQTLYRCQIQIERKQSALILIIIFIFI